LENKYLMFMLWNLTRWT